MSAVVATRVRPDDGTARAPRGAATVREASRVVGVGPAPLAAVGPPRLLLPPLVDDAHPVGGLAAPAVPALRSARASLAEELWPTVPAPAPRRAPLPDPLALCGPLVLTAVESLAGARPVAQMVRWVTPEVYEQLVDARAAAARTGTAPVSRRRCTVLRSLVCRVTDDVAEGTVVVHDGYRVRAAALRLEVHRERWRATVLQIG